MFNGEQWKPLIVSQRGKTYQKHKRRRRRKMDKRTYLKHLEEEYRMLTMKEIDIASRKAILHGQIEKIKDELVSAEWGNKKENK